MNCIEPNTIFHERKESTLNKSVTGAPARNKKENFLPYLTCYKTERSIYTYAYLLCETGTI